MTENNLKISCLTELPIELIRQILSFVNLKTFFSLRLSCASLRAVTFDNILLIHTIRNSLQEKLTIEDFESKQIVECINHTILKYSFYSEAYDFLIASFFEFEMLAEIVSKGLKFYRSESDMSFEISYEDYEVLVSEFTKQYQAMLSSNQEEHEHPRCFLSQSTLLKFFTTWLSQQRYFLNLFKVSSGLQSQYQSNEEIYKNLDVWQEKINATFDCFLSNKILGSALLTDELFTDFMQHNPKLVLLFAKHSGEAMQLILKHNAIREVFLNLSNDDWIDIMESHVKVAQVCLGDADFSSMLYDTVPLDEIFEMLQLVAKAHDCHQILDRMISNIGCTVSLTIEDIEFYHLVLEILLGFKISTQEKKSAPLPFR